MKAILVDQPGHVDAMRYGETAAPQPEKGDLLVRVRAAGVNRADLQQRRGSYPPPPGASPILGLEIAGEVAEPSGRWKVGDRVMAVVTGGGYAQECVVSQGMAMPIRDGFSFEQAAAIPEAFLTASMNLFALGHLARGETALIHAGASGVGSAAIQLARAAGARVFATAGSEAKRAFCAQLGAELAIDYRSEDFARRALEATDNRGVDVIIDFIGVAYWMSNLAALARSGRLLLVGFLGGTSGTLDLGPIMSKNLTVTGTTLRRTPLDRKTALTQDFVEAWLPKFATGELKPTVHAVFPIEAAADAHRMMEANANLGKIILRVD